MLLPLRSPWQSILGFPEPFPGDFPEQQPLIAPALSEQRCRPRCFLLVCADVDWHRALCSWVVWRSIPTTLAQRFISQSSAYLCLACAVRATVHVATRPFPQGHLNCLNNDPAWTCLQVRSCVVSCDTLAIDCVCSRAGTSETVDSGGPGPDTGPVVDQVADAVPEVPCSFPKCLQTSQQMAEPMLIRGQRS